MVEINIKITIDDQKLEHLKTGLAKAFNIDSTDINASWFKAFLKDLLYKYYKTGRIQIARETTAPIIDENIINIE